MLTRKRRHFVSLLAVATVAGTMLALTGTSFGAKPGGGGGGGGGSEPPPPPPLPNMRYEVKFIDLPPNGVPESSISFGRINIHGEYAGTYRHPNGSLRAYLHAKGESVDLNEMGAVGVPVGMAMRNSGGINDYGFIVGKLQDKTLSEEEYFASGQPGRGFILDYLATPPRVYLLPDEVTGPTTTAGMINNDGDILGRFRTADGTWYSYLYNPGLLVDPYNLEVIPFAAESLSGRGLFSPAKVLVYEGASPRVYTRGGQVDVFNVDPKYVIRPEQINDSGLMAGKVAVTVQTSRTKYRTDYYAARMTLTSVELLPGTELAASVHGFNNSGDVATSGNQTTQFIYRDDWGLVEVSNLVVGSTADRNLWATATGRRFRTLTDRIDIPGSSVKAGRLCGVCSYETGPVRYFILTPVAVPQ